MVIPYPETWYSATARKMAPFRTLAGIRGRHFDLAVVGAGLTGLSAALAAAEAGMSVCVLEARRVMWSASGRNGGQLLTGWRKNVSWLAEMSSPDCARSLFGLAEECKNFVKSRIRLHNIACDFVAGSADVAAKPRHSPKLFADARKTEALTGYAHFRYYDRQQTAGLLGTGRYYGAVVDQQAGHLHPLNYGLALADLARQRGVVIAEGTPVCGVVNEGDSVSVKTAEDKVTAKRVFIAPNGTLRDGAARIAAEADSRILAINGGIVATEPLSDAVAKTINPRNLCVSDSNMIATYFRLTTDRRLLFGSSESINPGVQKRRLKQIRRRLKQIYPALADCRFAYAWSGTLGITASRMPVLTVDPGGRIWSLGGFSGMGVALSALGALLIIPAMLGSKRNVLHCLQSLPARRLPGAPVLRIPFAFLAIRWFRFRDLLF